MKLLASLLVCLLLSACQHSGRYSQRLDSAPSDPPNNIQLHDATPSFEPYRAINSRPYTVLGKHYTPMKTGKGYVKHGVASWYGQKFHGHLTSNGEIYNMYAMSAAHKTLPLPSYVQVTNLDNNKTTIVRVNDRGPFHDNRIIDLSYAAASKLGVLDTGTAAVKLEVIHIDSQDMVTVGNSQAITAQQFAQQREKPLPMDKLTPAPQQTTKDLYIQVAALQDKAKVIELAKGLANLYQIPTLTPDDGKIFRLRLGPLESDDHAEEILTDLRSNGYSSAFKTYDEP